MFAACTQLVKLKIQQRPNITQSIIVKNVLRYAAYVWSSLIYNTSDTNETRVKKKFDFDKCANENVFAPLYILYDKWKITEKKQLHPSNYLFEMPRFHAKMRLKSAPQKLKFLMAEAISKTYTLDSCKCPCTFPHRCASNAGSFSIKTILCENTNIFLARTIESWVNWMLDFQRTFKIKIRLLWTVFKIFFTTAIICI